MWAGCSARHPRVATPKPTLGCRWGGHVESLRRRRGDAVAVELDGSLVDRLVVNVGSVLVSPFPSGSQPGGGQGPSSADDARTWRRPRSSPSVLMARTWRRGPASQQSRSWKTGRSSVNTDELEHATYEAERRVLEIQAKLHRWARDDPHRRFDDLFNLCADPAFLLVAWDRVRGNKGAKTAGVDGRTAASIAERTGVEEFLDALNRHPAIAAFSRLSGDAVFSPACRSSGLSTPGSRLRQCPISGHRWALRSVPDCGAEPKSDCASQPRPCWKQPVPSEHFRCPAATALARGAHPAARHTAPRDPGGTSRGSADITGPVSAVPVLPLNRTIPVRVCRLPRIRQLATHRAGSHVGQRNRHEHFAEPPFDCSPHRGRAPVGSVQ